MKINVAVHIPLFNILSVRQAYCLSIGGVNHCLCRPGPPRDAHDGRGRRSLSHGWEHPGPRFAYMLNRSEFFCGAGTSFSYVFILILCAHSCENHTCRKAKGREKTTTTTTYICLQFGAATIKKVPDRVSFKGPGALWKSGFTQDENETVWSPAKRMSLKIWY